MKMVRCESISIYSVVILNNLLIGGIYASSDMSSMGVGSGGIILNSPLKTLTMFDESAKRGSARVTFLERFKGGIASQKRAGKEMQEEEARRRKEEEEGVLSEVDELVESSSDETEAGQWAEYTLSKEEAAMLEKRRKMEEAFDKGFNSVRIRSKDKDRARVTSKTKEYQMVGVVMGEEGVKWYARKKPKNAMWNVRLVHVDKAAVLRDMFVNGQIDVFAKYENKGRASTETDSSGAVFVEPVYSIRQRNWRTLWNFNPLNYLTQRSGMYWREKRLPRQGLYTDGKSLFQSTYRYTEGKNGMKPIANLDFQAFLQKWNVPQSQKDSLQYKLDYESPDIVLEY